MRKVVVACLSLAALWTVLLFVGAATLPLYSVSSTTVTSNGRQETVRSTATLLQANGGWVFVILTIPALAVLLTAGLLALEPHHRWAGWAAWAPVSLVGILAVLGMLTIGAFLLPVVGQLGIAVLIVTLARVPSAQPSLLDVPPAAPLR